MRIIVQKFGGTSVADSAQRERAVDWIVKAREDGYHPVVVVSAMGRRGDPYATDTLLSLVEPHTLSARDLDLLMSCGEIIAAAVLASRLVRRGVDAQVLTGGQAGITTDETFGEARIVEVDPEPVRAVLAAGRVPVVAGFQGVTGAGEVTTLGRGGSDTTATALGAALKAEVVDIFTDVDGIKTADPRIVPEARTLATVDYEEVFQMAHLGARVIHPRAVEIAREFRVPVRVRSTFSASEGTLVAPRPPALDPWAHREPERSVTGVTYLEGLVQVVVTAPEDGAADWSLAMFDALARRGVSVDLINLFPDRAYFTVPTARRGDAEAALGALGLRYEMRADRAKVSIVGSAIHGLPGVMAQVVGALRAAGVDVLQTADSHSTISCLVDRAQMEKALRALHARFHLGEEVKPS
ncbi:MAG: aspartate kinase [Actinomycetia bacterium]|nr:aspartate kinase [Actinomycetes bacterium]